MAFFVSRVTVKDPDQLQRVWKSLKRLNSLHGCTYCRLLQAQGKPDTFLLIQDFPSMVDVYKYADFLGRKNVLEDAGVLDLRPEFYEETGEPGQPDASLSADLPPLGAR